MIGEVIYIRVSDRK